MSSVTNQIILHCQKQIKKEPSEEKLLHYLSRLDRLRVALQDLMDTGVGRTVNQLSRHDGPVGHVARKLVRKWKAMVPDQNSEDSEEDSQSDRSGSSSGEDDEEDGGPELTQPILTETGRDLQGRPSSHLDGLPHRLNARDYSDDPESDGSGDRLRIDDEDAGGEVPSPRQDSINIVVKKEKFLSRHSSGDSASEDDQFLSGATQPVVQRPNGKLDIHQDYASSSRNSNNNNHHIRDVKTIVKNSSRNLESSESEEESGFVDSHVKNRDNRPQIKQELDEDEFKPTHQNFTNGSRNSDGHRKLNETRKTRDSDDERQNAKSLQTSSQHISPIKKEVNDCSHQEHSRHKASAEVPREKHSSKEHRSDSKDRKEKHSRDKHSKHEESRKSHKHSEARNYNNPSTPSIKIKAEPLEIVHSEFQNPVVAKDKDITDSAKHSKHKDKSSKKDDEKKDRHSKHKHKDHKEKHRSRDRDESRERRKKHDKEKDTDKHDRKRKSNEDKDKHRSKISSSPEHKKPKLEADFINQKDKSSSKLKITIPTEEIDSTSGLNFGDALGCFDQTFTKVTKKESRDKSKQSVIPNTNSSKHSKDDKAKSSRSESDKDKKKGRTKHLESVIPPTLNISPFYKPSAGTALLARPPLATAPKPPNTSLSMNILENCDSGNYWEDSRISLNHGSRMNADDALSTMMSNRNQRTKVYSGVKAVCTGEVPRLFDLCMQVIKENIQDLGYTGGVPYDILKPALERATSAQLLQIEECNPYLIGETDELWKFHCKREFRGRDPEELESWRELHERCITERDQKFAIVRSKMLKKGEVAEPVRKAKLAYVEPVGGPRFNRHKASTIKNGMRSLKIKEEKGPKKGVGTSASVGFNNPVGGVGIVEEQAVIINPESRAGQAARPPVSRESTAKVKPRRAPLMAKTMKFIKTLSRR